MNASKLYAVEYSPSQRDWRINTLDKVLKANYEYFLGQRVRHVFPGVESADWILLGVCSSSEEANALVDRFEKIREDFVRKLQEARDSCASEE